MGMIEEIKKINDEKESFDERVRKMNEELVERMKNILTPVFKEFFELYPFVKGVAWTQYTPYFNDGEPCEFGVHEFYYTLNDEDVDSMIEEGCHPDSLGEWESNYSDPVELLETYRDLGAARPNNTWYPNKIKELEREVEELKNSEHDMFGMFRDLKAISNISDDVYRTLGEGLILVTPKGIDVMDYNHE